MIGADARKLRWDRAALVRFMVALALSASALFVIIAILDARSWGPGLHAFDYFLMAFYALLALLYLRFYARTRNAAHLGTALMLVLFVPYLYISQSTYSELRFMFYVIWLLLFFSIGPVRKRANPHFRQVLELAARPVQESMDGFTTRPFPAGKVSYSREEMVALAHFLMRHWIATAYIQPERVVLAICGLRWRHLFSDPRDFQGITHVAFDFSGNVSVNITPGDYHKFRERLTFDQLCASLGGLMITFLQQHRAGNEARILAVIEAEMSRSHWFFSLLAGDEAKNAPLIKG